MELAAQAENEKERFSSFVVRDVNVDFAVDAGDVPNVLAWSARRHFGSILSWTFLSSALNNSFSVFLSSLSTKYYCKVRLIDCSTQNQTRISRKQGTNQNEDNEETTKREGR